MTNLKVTNSPPPVLPTVCLSTHSHRHGPESHISTVTARECSETASHTLYTTYSLARGKTLISECPSRPPAPTPPPHPGPGPESEAPYLEWERAL